MRFLTTLLRARSAEAATLRTILLRECICLAASVAISGDVLSHFSIELLKHGSQTKLGIDMLKRLWYKGQYELSGH